MPGNKYILSGGRHLIIWRPPHAIWRAPLNYSSVDTLVLWNLTQLPWQFFIYTCVFLTKIYLNGDLQCGRRTGIDLNIDPDVYVFRAFLAEDKPHTF